MVKNPEVQKSVSMYIFVNLDDKKTAKMFHLYSKKKMRGSFMPVLLNFNF